MGGFSFFPPGIKFLLISNGAIFLAELLFGSFYLPGHERLNDFIVQYFSLWPIGSGNFYPWQLISYMFLHEGFTHILFNMFALWMFGVEVENTWGTKKFLIYYLICGLGGAAAHLVLSSVFGAENGPLLGASGAIFGVLVAFGLMFPDRSVYFFPLFFIPVKAKYFVGLYIALEVYAITSANDNVSHLAHLGGALTGIIYLLISTGGKILAMKRKPGWDGSGGNGAQRPVWRGPQQQPGFFGGRGRSSGKGAVDAEYRDINDTGTPINESHTDVQKGRVITQEEIDRILDKIAATGYQNLTSDERDVLFEASRRMEEKR
jgi:membrane associated rhomboid family serine protease